MKKLVLASVIAMTATASFATGNEIVNIDGNGVVSIKESSKNTGGITAGANGQHALLGSNYNGAHNQSTVVLHEDGSGTTTVTNNAAKPNGYISNPSLTTSGQDTCFGSSSGGISGPGFGISGGQTVVDENCIMMKQSKLLASLGLKDAAILLLMNGDEDIAKAVWGAHPELADHLTQVRD